MALLSTLCKSIQLAFLAYTVLALIFTSHAIVFSPIAHFALSPRQSLGSAGADESEGVARVWTSRVASHIRPGSGSASTEHAHAQGHAQPEDPPPDSDPWLLHTSLSPAPLYFPPSHSSPSAPLLERLGLGHANETPILQDTFLAKAFAHALHPTKIIPYYYRANASARTLGEEGQGEGEDVDVDEDDVTITTLVTSNRFKVFGQLVERYKGAHSLPAVRSYTGS